MYTDDYMTYLYHFRGKNKYLRGHNDLGHETLTECLLNMRHCARSQISKTRRVNSLPSKSLEFK